MHKKHQLIHNEQGFALVTALVFLVILTLMGVFATNTTVLETHIAGNDRLAKDAFYKTDGGIQTAIELIEENLACPNGFKTTTTKITGVDIFDLKFSQAEDFGDLYNTKSGNEDDHPGSVSDIPSDNYRFARISDDPSNRSDSQPRVNLTTYGPTDLLEGTSILTAAGYLGKSKSAAHGGAGIFFNVHAQYIGNNSTEAKIIASWLHLVGNQGTCHY